MLIKPWTELPPPRHLLDGDVEEAEEEEKLNDELIIPSITIEFSSKVDHQADFLVAVPHTLTRLMTNIKGGAQGHQFLGTVIAKYPTSTTNGDSETEATESMVYNEETQLYGDPNSSTRQKHSPIKIELNKVVTAGGVKIVYLSIPYTTDNLIINMVAGQLLPELNFKQFLGISIDNKLDSAYLLTTKGSSSSDGGIEKGEEVLLPPLTAPNYLTGAICSFISKATILNKDNIIVIGTNDLISSLANVCQYLEQVLKIQSKSYVEDCYKSLTYGSNINGLYV